MTDIRLSDADWTKVHAFFRQESRAYIDRDEQACRRFVEAVKWMSRSGAQWRLLPAEYGAWNTVYKRFVRSFGCGEGPASMAKEPRRPEDIRCDRVDHYR